MVLKPFKLAPAAQSMSAAQNLSSTNSKRNAILVNKLSKGGGECPTLPNSSTNALQFVHGNSNSMSPNANAIHKAATNSLRNMTVKSQGDKVVGYNGPKGTVLSGGSSFAMRELSDTYNKMMDYTRGFKKQTKQRKKRKQTKQRKKRKQTKQRKQRKRTKRRR